MIIAIVYASILSIFFVSWLITMLECLNGNTDYFSITIMSISILLFVLFNLFH